MCENFWAGSRETKKKEREREKKKRERERERGKGNEAGYLIRLTDLNKPR